MNKEKAKKELTNIKKDLHKIIKKYPENKWITEEEEIKIKNYIQNIYNRYLKLSACLDKKVPDFNKGIWPYSNNCYNYAMNFRKPQIFQDVYNKLFYELFFNQLGAVGNNKISKNITKEGIFSSLYADLDALKIKSYKSSIEKKTQHGGYKICIYYLDKENAILRPDYHFIRQNSNGIWSEKNGMNEEILEVKRLDKLETRPKYELIETLEIVKPNLKELSLKQLR